MTGKPTPHKYFWIFLFIFVSACRNQGIALPTDAPVASLTPIFSPAAPTPTFIPPMLSPSPLPTELVFPVLTPDPVQVERWKEYEDALAIAFFSSYYPPEDVVCDWIILGRAEQEVYMWAYCANTYSGGPSQTSIPAVIYLEENGSVKSAEIPGDGTAYARDIRRMFPPELHQRIFNHLNSFEGMDERMRWRRGHPDEPPLIVLNSLSIQPTPAVIPWITPDPGQVRHWREYEIAIAERLTYLPPDTTLCEWELLGRAGNEVYVWAICGEINGERVGLEDIFRVDVNEDGSVQNALLHGLGIFSMLPPEAKEKYFSGSIHFQELVDHLRWRQSHPEDPPLIVLNATQTP